MLKPFGQRVIVTPIPPPENETALFIPDAYREGAESGTVVAVGDVSGLKEGDIVLYGRRSGTTITVEKTDYLILRPAEILAIQ